MFDWGTVRLDGESQRGVMIGVARIWSSWRVGGETVRKTCQFCFFRLEYIHGIHATLNQGATAGTSPSTGGAGGLFIRDTTYHFLFLCAVCYRPRARQRKVCWKLDITS